MTETPRVVLVWLPRHDGTNPSGTAIRWPATAAAGRANTRQSLPSTPAFRRTELPVRVDFHRTASAIGARL